MSEMRATPLRYLRLLFVSLFLLALGACRTTVVPPGDVPSAQDRSSTTEQMAPTDRYAFPSAGQQVERTPPPIQRVPSVQTAWPSYDWARHGSRAVHIGVILPLHGRYARYGQVLLDGIRLAAANPDWRSVVKITVADAADGKDAAVRAYERLVHQGVNWVIGPLLKENVEAIVPRLRADIPVLSLSKHVDLASRHPALFIHSIARSIQARFMAREAIRNGMKRMAVITAGSAAEKAEAAAFVQSFIALGGEVAGSLQLDRRAVNYIPQLRRFRSVIDDDLALRDLDLGLRIFSPLTNLDIRIPPGVDGLYLATPGSMVAKLGGQLAYVDLRKLPMFGSNRWMDRHLLDDSGRYLTKARFSQPGRPSRSGFLVTQYRQIWGRGEPDVLFALGYDTAHIALWIGSRLELRGQQAIQALHAQDGFPAEGGHVRFDMQGVGEKSFDLFGVQDGRIVLRKQHG